MAGVFASSARAANVSDNDHLVAVAVLYRGFSSAYSRLMGTGRIATEPADALIPLFEALVGDDCR